MKAYVAEHGKVPDSLYDGRVKEADITRQLLYYRNMPKCILGERKVRDVKDGEVESVRKEAWNDNFTQDRIDFLTEHGMNWMLTHGQVQALKEKGLNFPMPGSVDDDYPRPMDGDVVGLEEHSWLTMFEALVEFRREHGHAHPTADNSSEELAHWAEEQKKKMRVFAKGGTPRKDKQFRDYQAEMLSGIGFVFSKPDVNWMENYERLVAFRRLFGTVAVTDKFVSFEALLEV